MVNRKLADVNMLHHLAYFPLEGIQKIKDKSIRDNVEDEWIKARDNR